MGLSVGVHNKAKPIATMGIKVKLADGREFQIGTLSNKPIVSFFQRIYVAWKIKRFRNATNRSAQDDA